MHSEDFTRAMLALAAAGIVTESQAVAASTRYEALRADIERDAAVKADRLLNKPFMKLMSLQDPWLGFPIGAFALVAVIWAVVTVFIH